MISLIKSLFGGSSAEQKTQESAAPDGAVPSPKAPSPGATDSSQTAEFVEYVVKALVSNPEDVALRTVEKDRLSVFEITCRKEDIGKIVGRKGRTIGAIRTLASGAAGRDGKKVAIEVLD